MPDAKQMQNRCKEKSFKYSIYKIWKFLQNEKIKIPHLGDLGLS